MLLEAAMVELGQETSSLMLHDETQRKTFNFSAEPGKLESTLQGQNHLNVIENIEYTSNYMGNADVNHAELHINNEEISVLQDDHSKEHSIRDDYSSSSSSNVGSMSDTSPHDYNNNGGISLLHDDHDFASRVLNRELSNLGESGRFGSYRSTAAVAAGGVPFQWEEEPGKSKSPTIKEDEEELPPLSLPPIRLSASASTHNNYIPPHKSPSSSAAPSPRSLTGKMKSLIINHVKKPSMDHFSFTSILEPQRSPSRRSPQRSKRERKHSSLSTSEYGSIQSSSVTASPYTYPTSLKNGNMRKNEEFHGPRSSLNSSDPSSSPYYFSPLSNSSSLNMGHGIISPRLSVTQSSSGSTISNGHSHSASVSSHASSRASNSSISSVTSAVNMPANGAAMLANCLLSITSMSDVQLPHARSENARDRRQDGSSSLSFAFPEMEILNEGLLTSANYIDGNIQQGQPVETTMEEFINRGGPLMKRSLSTSRVTFADDLYRKPTQKSKYFSAQLISNLAQPKSTHLSPMQDPATANLDVLFPLKRPNNSSKAGANILEPKHNMSQSEESPDDRQTYVDALDTSLDCSVMTDNEELNSMVDSLMNDQLMKERPAHEVVIPSDENGFAYSPVASAFVFSPRKASENAAAAAKHHFIMPSSPPIRANSGNGSSNGKDQGHFSGLQPKSILKKKYSQELNRAPMSNPDSKTVVRETSAGALMSNPDVKTAVRESLPAWHGAAPHEKSLTHSGSQKISSVLLRFAEAEEQIYNSKRHHQHQGSGMRSPACMQPMCSFLGRAFLCRTKLASRLHP